MSDKLCIFCRSFFFSEGSPGYSELTPGYGASIYCKKNRFALSLGDITEEEFRKTLLLARSCFDYVPDAQKTE